MKNKRVKSAISVVLVLSVVNGCATMKYESVKSIKKRAYETRVYEATYEETWMGVMTLFQDLDIMPTFTDKTAGLIKAEVPYTDYKIGKKILLTCMLWWFAIPYWISTEQANMVFTAYIKPLDSDLTSVRLLGVSSKGKKIWKAEKYPELHNRVQEILSQRHFLEGTGTNIE